MKKKNVKKSAPMRPASAPEKSVLPPASEVNSRTRGLVVLGVVLIALWVIRPFKGCSRAGVTGSSAASSAPAEAPKIPGAGLKVPKLELQEAGQVAWDNSVIRDIQVDAQGVIYLAVPPRNVVRIRPGKEREVKELPMVGEITRIALDGNQLWAAENMATKLYRIDTKTFKFTKFPVKDSGNLLSVIVDAKRGRLLVSDTGKHFIHVLNREGGSLGHIGGPAPAQGGLDRPVDIQVGPDGSIYVCDHFSTKIVRYTSSGKKISEWLAPWSSPNSDSIRILNGNLYLNASVDHILWIYDLNGKVRNIVTSSNKGYFGDTRMIGAGKDGYLYLATGPAILKLKPAPASEVLLETEPQSAPKSLTPAAKKG